MKTLYYGGYNVVRRCRKRVCTGEEAWRGGGDNGCYRMPESFNAFCNIVSLTAANTSRMFEVSVACVR